MFQGINESEIMADYQTILIFYGLIDKWDIFYWYNNIKAAIYTTQCINIPLDEKCHSLL